MNKLLEKLEHYHTSYPGQENCMKLRNLTVRSDDGFDWVQLLLSTTTGNEAWYFFQSGNNQSASHNSWLQTLQNVYYITSSYYLGTLHI